jgi:UPF0176 protein
MHEKYIGKVVNYYKKHGVAEILLHQDLDLGGTVIIKGKTTQPCKQKVSSMQLNNKSISSAKRDSSIAIKISSIVRKNDEVYLLTDEKYHVLLYYKYQTISDPKEFCKQHFIFCKQNQIRGRVLVANEGINGTVAGLKEDIEKYKSHLATIFNNIEFKESIYDNNPFRKLFVRDRKEIVVLDQQDITPQDGGTRLKADEFKKILDNYNPEEYVIVDTRNNYESKIGKFKHALTLDIEYFRDFPKTLGQLGKYKDKKVITYCTGGIRCEKASAFLKKHGFKDVYQLDGGIVKFGQKYPKGYYEGLCYVFDDRRAIPIDDDSQIITNCDICKTSCNIMVNCSNPECNKQFVCCNECRDKVQSCCSQACINSPIKVKANV